jgi:hypothetical protein
MVMVLRQFARAESFERSTLHVASIEKFVPPPVLTALWVGCQPVTPNSAASLGSVVVMQESQIEGDAQRPASPMRRQQRVLRMPGFSQEISAYQRSNISLYIQTQFLKATSDLAYSQHSSKAADSASFREWWLCLSTTAAALAITGGRTIFPLFSEGST